MAIRILSSENITGNLTLSGNQTTGGDAYVTGTSNSLVVISRDNMFVDAGQFYLGADDGTTDDSFRQRTASGSYFIESRKSGTWTNRLQINTAGTLIVQQGMAISGNIDGVGATFIGTAASGAALVTIENNSGSTATSYGLLVLGGGNSSNGRTFEVRDDSGNTDLIVKGNGNVGIGTSLPATKLNVANAGEVIVRSSMTAADGYRGGFEADNQHTGGTIWSMFSTNNSDGYFGGGKFVIANESMGGVDANTTAKFVINGSGNVGIGTISPSAKLEIVTAVGADAIRMNYGQSADIFLGFASANPRILLQDNTNVVTHNFQSNGDNYIVGSNVGIGTTSPDSVLHIKDNTAGPTQLSIQSNDFSRAEEINFLNPSTSAISGQIKYYTNPTVEYMSFSTSNNSAAAQRMLIDGGGSIIIGAGGTSGTPSADYRSLEIGRQGNTITGAPWKSNLYFSTNATITAGSTTFTARYLNELPMLYTMEDGIFAWSSASLPSSVGDTITFSEKMRINSSGNVGIGDTAPTSISINTSSLSVNSSRNDLSGGLISKANGTVKHQQYWDSSGYSFNLTASSGVFKFNGADVQVNANIKANDVDGKIYSMVASWSYVASKNDLFSFAGTEGAVWEYTIKMNPNTAGSGAYRDFYYGKLGVGIGWNGSNVTQYIWQQQDQTAPRTLYDSGGGNFTPLFRMYYSGGIYTELALNTAWTLRIQGLSTTTYGDVFFRRLA